MTALRFFNFKLFQNHEILFAAKSFFWICLTWCVLDIVTPYLPFLAVWVLLVVASALKL